MQPQQYENAIHKYEFGSIPASSAAKQQNHAHTQPRMPSNSPEHIQQRDQVQYEHVEQVAAAMHAAV